LGERKHRYVFSVLTFDELKKSWHNLQEILLQA
jgi:hypothetical protein